jgi:hypothetical protein
MYIAYIIPKLRNMHPDQREKRYQDEVATANHLDTATAADRSATTAQGNSDKRAASDREADYVRRTKAAVRLSLKH